MALVRCLPGLTRHYCMCVRRSVAARLSVWVVLRYQCSTAACASTLARHYQRKTASVVSVRMVCMRCAQSRGRCRPSYMMAGRLDPTIQVGPNFVNGKPDPASDEKV